MNIIAKMLIISGIIIITAGIILLLLDKTPSIPFRLPGDIFIKRKNFVFYFPLGLSILLSIILSIIFRIFRN